MKRSDINAIIREADDFIRAHGFHLPPFAHWTPDEWKTKGPEVREIAVRKLGWDVTDFNLGEYRRTGLLLFTVRNGDVKDPDSKRTFAYYKQLNSKVQALSALGANR